MNTESGSEGSNGAEGSCANIGDEILKAISDMVHEGNVRHVVIKHADGRTFAEFPVSMGLAGALLFPGVVGIGAIATLLTNRTIEVVRTTDEDD